MSNQDPNIILSADSIQILNLLYFEIEMINYLIDCGAMLIK
jgi:hypothetical protein